ncbi:alkaline phosphatase [Rossellomorea vietnamensis]|uniref:Alkaline phosphatase n=2 Tax=Bacillaceae TaxID=186817 RepID=A0A5D4LXT2_9BACI|nr:alkaline phosphatase [Rossellomorea vietnamensis]
MSNSIKKQFTGMTVAATLAISSLGFASDVTKAAAESKEPTNVIMMVMDGTSAGATTLARWYKGGNLAMDEIMIGGVRTHSAESAITDSAPAGTALSTGHKSNDKVIGLLPSLVNSPGVAPVAPEDAHKPVVNVLEGAKQLGKATGIISTSEIQHATPAAFSAHVPHRSNYADIAEQQVYQGMDVVLGGGKDSLMLGNKARVDGEDLLKVVNDKGYDFVETREALLKSDSEKIWGAFAPSALAYDFDRKAAESSEPSIADMTEKAIDTLSKDEDGFFLFVEGSKVDWAAHANDPIGMISDVLAFDDAVNEAMEFAKEDGNTMVIAVSDHGNSGITMGNQDTNGNYPEIPVSAYIDPLKKATLTAEGALKQMKPDFSNLKEIAGLYGLDDLTAEEIDTLKASKDGRALQSAMVNMLASRAKLGFTTGGHTGEDVFLYAYGPSRPTGLVDNTDIAKSMAGFMGIDLKEMTDKLFVNAKESFEKQGYATRIDVSDANNPVFVAEKGEIKIELPENKNVSLVTNGSEESIKTLNGITVYNDKDFYVSAQALNPELEPKFKDVSEDYWAYEYIQDLAGKGIINGVSEDMYDPQGSVTRGQFIALIARSLDLKASKPVPFTDVEGGLAIDIAAAYEAGITTGTSATTFEPNKKINREQMAAMLIRAYEHKTGTALEAKKEVNYEDKSKISPVFKEYVQIAAELGFMNGNDNQFNPKNDATRAQAAKVIFYFHKK